jgi:glyoxylase-like metal-dependent hydrolase (beta-lactamase superfamily II)
MEQSVKRINLGFVNTYLLQAGDGYVLIDTGISDVWTRLESELLSLGCLPERLKLVILTHGDMDHAGNCKKLQQKYGINIAMHRGDFEMVSTGSARPRSANTLPGKLMTWMASRMKDTSGCFEPNLYLEDKQNLQEFDLDAAIIHTPGHTQGSITILTAAGDLIVGDTLSNRRIPKTADLFENEQELQTSLTKLRGLKAETIYPGHGKPFLFTQFPE